MVNFFNADVAYILRDKRKLSSWIQSVAKKKKFSINSLNLILCSDEYLYKLNVQHLNHDNYTDILTFDYSENKGILQGEIYISIDRVKDNAGKLNITFKNELHRVMIHGVLHLCGYRDKYKAQKAEMTLAEDKALATRDFI